jgi:hypoxanthine-DNA glycosylase
MKRTKLKTGLGLLVGKAPTVLILGSFPSEESLRLRQYYANPRNQFWRLMEAIVSLDQHQPYQRRVQAITAKGIALWDVLHACERVGSLDNKIKRGSAVMNNINGLLDQMPSIRMIALNGRTAAKIFDRNFDALRARELEIVNLPSSSSANAVKLEQKVRAWSVLTNSTGRGWLQQNRDAFSAYYDRVEKHGMFSDRIAFVQRQLDEQLAALRSPGAADRLRAAIKSPAHLRGRVKTKA